MLDKVKIAAVQIDVKMGEKRENLDKVLLTARDAASRGADLIVFPECALSGYVFSSRDEAKPFMETIPGPSTNELIACCRDLNVHIVVGLLEADRDRCFNAAVLLGPGGLIGKYRKAHLPFLGVDRFLDPGDGPFKVYKTPVGNIGIHICYDCAFPESVRVMALIGADIVALPTNWPLGREKVAKYVVVTRAYENRVHLVAADRVGIERGTKFIGQSKIVNAWGDVLAEGNSDDEQTILGEVALSEAREKHVVFKPGEFEVDFGRDRRPELYGEITRAYEYKPKRQLDPLK